MARGARRVRGTARWCACTCPLRPYSMRRADLCGLPAACVGSAGAAPALEAVAPVRSARWQGRCHRRHDDEGQRQLQQQHVCILSCRCCLSVCGLCLLPYMYMYFPPSLRFIHHDANKTVHCLTVNHAGTAPRSPTRHPPPKVQAHSTRRRHGRYESVIPVRIRRIPVRVP